MFIDQNSSFPNPSAAPCPPGQYMQQDEEWEREGLLDPAWEKQQRKVSMLLLYTIVLCYIIMSSIDRTTVRINF